MDELYEDLKQFCPGDEAEARARTVMLREMERQGARLLDRENEAHFTASAFVVNPGRDRVLMVHHNLRDAWAWPGGHADGVCDMEANARRELWEETGVQEARQLGGIASLEIFNVPTHVKRGRVVEAHRHFSIAYLYEVDETAQLKVCPGENSSVEWLAADRIAEPLFSAVDVRLYRKLLKRACVYI